MRERFNLKSNPTLGLIAATIGFFVGFAAVALYGVTAKELKEIMMLSGAQMGLLVAAPHLTGSLLRIPFGAWVDKIGGKKPLLILLALSCVGIIGLSILFLTSYPAKLTNDTYPLILFLGFLCGCGIASFSVGVPQTSYWYPRHQQGWALGTYAGLGNTAPGISTIMLAILLPWFGLPGTYLAWIPFIVVGMSVYWWISQDAYYFQLINKGVSREESITIAKQLGQELIPSGKFWSALSESGKLWRTWALVFLYFTSFGGFLGLTSWLPTYWRVFHGVHVTYAGILGGAGFSLLASFVRVYGGYLSDRWGGESINIFGFTIIVIGGAVLVLADTFVVALIGEFLLAIGMGCANAAVFKLVPKYVTNAVGGASGWVGGLGAFGGFVMPPILGWFVDYHGRIGYSRGFIVYIVLGIICIFISSGLKYRFGKQPD